MQKKNTTESIRLIVNPRAGGGRAGAQIDKLRNWVSQRFEHAEVDVLTEAPGHATKLAAMRRVTERTSWQRSAVTAPATRWSMGSSSTRSPSCASCIFTVIPFGTGSDLVRSLRMPLRTEEALAVAAKWNHANDRRRRRRIHHRERHSERALRQCGRLRSKRRVSLAGAIRAASASVARSPSSEPHCVHSRATSRSPFESPRRPPQGVQLWEDELLALRGQRTLLR